MIADGMLQKHDFTHQMKPIVAAIDYLACAPSYYEKEVKERYQQADLKSK
jgi:hypothetical protein